MGVSNSFYGTKLFLNAPLPDVANYIERMNVANVELTQVVSQMTGPPIVSVGDDLLHTPRMTIEDLIEATEHGHVSLIPMSSGLTKLALDARRELVLWEVNSIATSARCQGLQFLGVFLGD
ncbi:hypothetical protein TSUD_416450 [Trifolium subterraneum]|uniref:Uncharacterized protein n=1 Tax=Trifolium subterraneum TaxID=3900 RepID=A0A2Z6P644_TRISU|nr:hypothetical protein TSUD_416450 [Trifolium subterraneum]